MLVVPLLMELFMIGNGSGFLLKSISETEPWFCLEDLCNNTTRSKSGMTGRGDFKEEVT